MSALCSSGYLVGRLHHGGDAAGEAAVQGKRPYPSTSPGAKSSRQLLITAVHEARSMDARAPSKNLCVVKLDRSPPPPPDLDQLQEIMKVTGTPAGDFVVKLQSQDVCVYPS